MRLPINFLLYLTSASLLGQAGWLFCHATPKLYGPAPEDMQKEGLKQGTEGLKRGKGRGATTSRWNYLPQDWWMTFRDVNFIGKPPPPPPDAGKTNEPPPPPPPTEKPLTEIIEIVALVSDWREQGRTPDSSLVVRYKPEANVEPPPDEVRRRQLQQMTSGPGGGLDVVAQPPPQPRRGRPPANQPASPLPISTPSNEWIQYVKVGDTLWGQYADIKLVRVAAESAWFVRVREGAEGEPKEEQLDKSAYHLSDEVRRAIETAGGRAPVQSDTAAGPAGATQWVEGPTTRRVGNLFMIGTDDERQFQENYEDMLAGVNLDTYRSPYDSSLRGVQIANIDPALASRFGVSQGEVILAVNNEPVQSRSEALSVGKRQYNRGTRTFVVKFLSAGQIIERTYQAPDRR